MPSQMLWTLHATRFGRSVHVLAEQKARVLINWTKALRTEIRSERFI